MASSHPFVHITLSERDVPGAKFIHQDITQHTVLELKRWLECRGPPVSGKKEDLIHRCQLCIDSGKADAISVAIDAGKWYEQKVQAVLQERLEECRRSQFTPTNDEQRKCLTPPMLPIVGWKTFPSRPIPKMYSYGTIYQYLVESAKFVSNPIATTNCSYESDAEEQDGNSFHISKSLKRGRTYFLSGHVQDIMDNCQGSHYFLKSKVMSSFKTDTFYDVSLTLESATAQVVDASCQCKASAMGRCSHVSGLLLAVEDYTIQFGYLPAACTSKSCEWNKGRKKQKRPMAVQVPQYNKRNRTDIIIQHDPRPTSNQTDTHDLDFKNNFIKTLPLTGKVSMWETLLKIKYDDYTLSSSELEILRLKCQQLVENLKPDGDRPVELSHTSDQANNSVWYQERLLRLTASKCKDVVKCRTEKCRDRFLRDKLWCYKQIKTQAISYGVCHENEAFEKYKTERPEATVTKTGLWVNPKHPELGCSPDGLVQEADSRGLLEIKCPFILKDCHPCSLENLTKQQKNGFCCTLVDGRLKLKMSHAYYYQVQMQMGVCEMNWCDFVIWSKQGMTVERIPFNSSFWDAQLKVLKDFHSNCLAPEYFEMRLLRGLSAFDLS